MYVQNVRRREAPQTLQPGSWAADLTNSMDVQNVRRRARRTPDLQSLQMSAFLRTFDF